MIDCLVDYIGLKRVKDDPTSGVFINDLHGITTNQFEIIREISENDGTEESWETLEDMAIRSFERDIMTNLRKYYQNHQIISSGLTGYIDNNTLADHDTTKYVGWLFDMNAYSQNMKIEINDVRLTLASDENFNVKIFDANTGDELFTKAVVGVEGLNIVKVLQSYAVTNHNKIFVCYDTVIPIKVNEDSTIQGFISPGSIDTTSTVLAADIAASESGMAVGYNVKCSIEEFVCSRLDLFQQPYLYKLGIEFLKEGKYSDVFSRYNLLDTEQKDELILDYTENYQRLMDSTFLDIKVPDDGICFICNKAITKKTLIP